MLRSYATPPTLPVLLFLPTFVRDHGFPESGWSADGEPYRLYRTLEGAEGAAISPDGVTGRVLVLDPAGLTLNGDTTAHVPRSAVLNIDVDGDYWRPAPIIAAGGYVVRRDESDLEVLLIFRRGAWDLPKGKLDPGESVRETAVREVAEEVGIKQKKLSVTAHLGTTAHGYIWPKAQAYAVKTTYWYAMTTTAESFKPEKREGIEAVEWAGWDDARDRLGFETLTTHLSSIDTDALGV
ncbi:NUDIX hydrolase [Rubrivirga sp.]|uniref:NUDIX hydrolase n=1 Tax=Rubrivirga sp. TaxID=1885344 RepID=UPI003C718582